MISGARSAEDEQATRGAQTERPKRGSDELRGKLPSGEVPDSTARKNKRLDSSMREEKCGIASLALSHARHGAGDADVYARGG